MIPFSVEVFFASLEDYNAAIWPRQILFMLLGVACVWFALHPSRRRGQLAGLVLAAAWLHTAITYHFGYFAELNFWDYGIGTAFLIQAILILIWLWRGKFSAAEQSHVAAAFTSAGLLLMPNSVFLFGRGFTETGWFGCAPVPTIVFTAGALMFAAPGSFALWLLPVVLSLAALVPALGVPAYEDLLAALVPLVMIYLIATHWKNNVRE